MDSQKLNSPFYKTWSTAVLQTQPNNSGVIFFRLQKMSFHIFGSSEAKVHIICHVLYCDDSRGISWWLMRNFYMQIKDLSKVKPGFKSVHLQIYFETTWLASAKKWREIQNEVGEECF